ncbi:MAG: T9SS type A sorting domain-containing protein [Bacteroidetes bacterium]|nr:T9SS type A sorting domain-containing protein [Bacteroidota bacterium]
MKKTLTNLVFFCSLLFSASAQQTTINGPAGSGQFGYSITVLANGNYVVTDPDYDEGSTANVGAVYLYNGSTHALISTLKGSTANDNVGDAGITALSNGNFVVASPGWDNGANSDAGAVTWCNGSSGLSGVVSSSNSLVGTTANDRVGIEGVTALSNRNYVVKSPYWNNGAAFGAGAVTWGNGTSGIAGAVSSSNSLVGSTTNDQVGNDDITELSNGNYVVRNSSWDNGAALDAGAVTWGSGTTGISGVVSSSNSMVGLADNDMVGEGGVTALSNGNYVVSSPYWNNGVNSSAGAVTWGSGTTGITGIVSSSNSLVGSTTNDMVGESGVIALSNGNYVVASPDWDNGGNTNAGAATWGNGTTGITGVVSSSNSLVGSTTNDNVGKGNSNNGITILSNGNYVVTSPEWDNGGTTNAGAVTWGNGTSGITGVVSSSNSLVGTTPNDYVGESSVTALTNGNYVVSSPSWSNGSATDAGAATWGNGSTGITGVVSSSNSLVGSSNDDEVAVNGVMALANGNYVVVSPYWNNGSIAYAGAVTWGNGSTGITGVVSSSNSLVGSTDQDYIGFGPVTPLANGNYVVTSPLWDNGAVSEAGAATWGNGSTGITGIVSSSNSLIGASPNDNVGNDGVVALANGNYVVRSSYWNNGSISYAGAVTWGSGTTGATGVVNSTNSLVGGTEEDFVGAPNTIGHENSIDIAFTTLANGDFIMSSRDWDNGFVTDAGAVTWGNGSTGVYGLINSCNSVMGTVTGELNYVFNNSHDYLLAGSPATNSIIVFNPTGQALAINLDADSKTIEGNSNVPFVSNSSCRIICSLEPNGAQPVHGLVDAKVWIESSVPDFAGQPFVARHFEITPATDPSSSTGRVTLYFTQQEFTDFNNHSGSILDLPTNEGDASGKANLRIGKYPGISNNGTGLPGTYSSGANVINPNDNDIVWNSSLNRWEVSFDVTSFSGLVVQTTQAVLPLNLLDFNGRLQNDDALLSWKTENEINTDQFFVERSTDGSSFTVIGTLNARNQPGINQYNYKDAGVSSLGVPILYYRLRQTDLDGRFMYSRIIALPVDHQNQLFLYPNPVSDVLMVTVSSERTETMQVRIVDNAGREMLHRQWTVFEGSSTKQLEVSKLAKGIYFLEMNGKNTRQRKVFVKQ